MALSVPHHLDSQISVQGIGRSRQRSDSRRHPGNLRFCRVRGYGVECSKGPRASGGDGPAEGCDFRSDGPRQRSDSDEGVQSVSGIAQKALLGQSFLVQGVLRGLHRFGCRNDPQICTLSGKAREAARATAIGLSSEISMRRNSFPSPLRGQGISCPPVGG